MGAVADLEFDPYSLQCLEDPYPVYNALLEGAPLYHCEKRGFWAVHATLTSSGARATGRRSPVEAASICQAA